MGSFQISVFKFQFSDFSFQFSDFSFQISDFSFQISVFRFQFSERAVVLFGYRQQIQIPQWLSALGGDLIELCNFRCGK